MDMVRHDDIGGDVMAVCFKYVEPVIYQIITVGYLKKRQPVIAGESDEEVAAAEWHFCFDGYRIKVRMVS
jgi:hypothetical protein